MTPAPAYPELAAVVAGASADPPRKVKRAVAKVAESLPAGELPLFFEEACRRFEAAGLDEFPGWAFAEARKVEKNHPSVRDMDRLHDVFLEFVPLGVVPPMALRDHVKLMAAELPAGEAHERFQEILDSGFAAGFVPYARLFPDTLTLAKAAGIKKAHAEEALAERLLRTGVLPGASHAVWRAARRPLGRIATDDDDLRELLAEAEPDQDSELVAEIRNMWLEALAEARAGEYLPPEWFFTRARRSAPELLIRLVDQAGDRLPPTGPKASYEDDPSLYESRSGRRNDHQPTFWDRPDTDFEAIAAKLDGQPWERRALRNDVDTFVHGLGYYANVDYVSALRRFCSVPALRDLLREMVDGWKRQAASGSLPELQWALDRLVPLARTGYAEPAFSDGMEIADPLAALIRTVRGGSATELAIPGWGAQVSAPGRVVQNGAFLTVAWHRRFQVIAPERVREAVQGPPAHQGIGVWYDGETAYFSRIRNGAWETFEVAEDPSTGAVLTLDDETRKLRPESPSSAEFTFPGAAAPARVSYSRNVLTVTAHDGAVIARLPAAGNGG
ncbi:hypothetical protein ACFQ07_29925, partial [Actinomadura adrarensis]